MFLTPANLRQILFMHLDERRTQGCDTDALRAELSAAPDSLDALMALAPRVAELEVPGRPYFEPNSLEEIWSECDPSRPAGAIGKIDIEDCRRRVEAAFEGRVCGCVLGKPLEVNPTLDEIRAAAEAAGEWPLRDYVSEKMLDAMGRRHSSWDMCVKGKIAYVAPDDDINYAVIGMLLMERHGLKLTRSDVMNLWLEMLPVRQTFGPERVMLLKAGVRTFFSGPVTVEELESWATLGNFKEEYCGALIRADAFGYACPGRPALAAELAWRDAAWTHRRTGLYGEMFIAAAIAAALVLHDPMEIFAVALKFVPRRSRFHKIVSDSANEVASAKDWLDGYRRIHGKYAEYVHCRVYQEVGTVINSLRFAEDVADGFCMQVAQGNDTDSFGATAGSLLGALFGPGHLHRRWLDVFNDDIRTSLAQFYERSLGKLTKRMGELPGRIAKELESAAVEQDASAKPRLADYDC
jgi:ADP-ribosylglycohydrolase